MELESKLQMELQAELESYSELLLPAELLSVCLLRLLFEHAMRVLF